MVGTVNEEYNALVKALNESKYTKEESFQILSDYINALLSNKCIIDDRLWATSMITSNFTKRVRQHEWKFAHGFFGNWAKHHEQKDIETFDVNDIGC